MRGLSRCCNVLGPDPKGKATACNHKSGCSCDALCDDPHVVEVIGCDRPEPGQDGGVARFMGVVNEVAQEQRRCSRHLEELCPKSERCFQHALKLLILLVAGWVPCGADTIDCSSGVQSRNGCCQELLEGSHWMLLQLLELGFAVKSGVNLHDDFCDCCCLEFVLRLGQFVGNFAMDCNHQCKPFVNGVVEGVLHCDFVGSFDPMVQCGWFGAINSWDQQSQIKFAGILGQVSDVLLCCKNNASAGLRHLKSVRLHRPSPEMGSELVGLSPPSGSGWAWQTSSAMGLEPTEDLAVQLQLGLMAGWGVHVGTRSCRKGLLWEQVPADVEKMMPTHGVRKMQQVWGSEGPGPSVPSLLQCSCNECSMRGSLDLKLLAGGQWWDLNANPVIDLGHDVLPAETVWVGLVCTVTVQQEVLALTSQGGAQVLNHG